MSETVRENAYEIVRRLRSAGFQAYIVGGAVRDMVMGIEPKDYDIATAADSEDVERLFENVVPVGRRFGVNLVILGGISYEVAMFRTEGEYVDGRRPASVCPADIAEDVMRRDFTVNAMAYDPVEDRIIDLIGGRTDIENRIIRTVGDPVIRFSEDRLRMLRAVRFAAQLDFDLEEGTKNALSGQAHAIQEVSNERIGDELARMFTGPRPATALTLLDETGLLREVLPEVAAMKGVEQPSQFHPEGDVFEHTRRMLEYFNGGPVSLAFGILLHDAGKPATFTETDRIRFNRHDEVGADIASGVMKRLRFSREREARVRYLVKNHMRFIHVREMKQSTFRRFTAEDGFDELIELFRLDCLASHASLDTYDFVKHEMERNKPELPEPLISGADLIHEGYEPGPLYGVVLGKIADAQLEGLISTREEALEMARRLFPPDQRRQSGRKRRNSPRD